MIAGGHHWVGRDVVAQTCTLHLHNANITGSVPVPEPVPVVLDVTVDHHRDDATATAEGGNDSGGSSEIDGGRVVPTMAIAGFGALCSAMVVVGGFSALARRRRDAKWAAHGELLKPNSKSSVGGAAGSGFIGSTMYDA